MRKQFLKNFYFLFIGLAFFNKSFSQNVNSIQLSETASAGSFPLISAGKSAAVVYDATDAKVVKTAAELFANDIKLVSGTQASVSNNLGSSPLVIIGTNGKSKFVTQLAAAGKIQISGLKDQWETYTISIVDNPFPNIKQAVVIAGSDPRGTAFGVLELSKLMGVHPFYWWADIPVKQHKELYIRGSLKAETPSVRYRGIFLNDEDWGLQPWAAKTFEPETGDIGPKTYSKIFELLLRLKANLIWPAMHPSTKAFYSYPGNKKVAEEYGIIVGSSHAEPMLRNNVGEWDEKTMGHFNYLINKETVYNYWESRVKESSSNDAIYTLGMRGVHDSGIEGVKSTKEAIPLVERIIADQRGMLQKYINKDVTKIPQAFTAYKEVLEVYDGGLKLPDDVTLVWPDDNYGYIQRLNNENEANRSGGSGVYYHASYWGRPHDYLWLSSTNPALIREEMMKAYDNKSNKLWVLNVGDIKPLEFNMQMFLDMAYNAVPFKDPKYTNEYLTNWTSTIFGNKQVGSIAGILRKYYQLAFERRPEFMGWSQTEPTTQTAYTSYNHFYFGDEAQRRIDAYNSIEAEVKKLRSEITGQNVDAFYQLVYYPVVCAAEMNKKFLYRDKAYLYAKQNRASAKDYAEWSQEAYSTIAKETEYYNKQLSGGKWNNMMSMHPRDLPVYKAPVLPKTEMNSETAWDVIPEGWAKTDSSIFKTASGDLQLPAFNKSIASKYFIDLFLSEDKELRWEASAKAKWIKLSQYSGTLKPETGKKETRIWVEIDWTKAPAKSNLQSAVEFKGDGKKKVILISAINHGVPDTTRSYIENNGLVSVFAENFSRKSAVWTVMEGLGHAGNVVASSMPAGKLVSETPDPNATVEYDFYTLNPATPEINIYTLPTLPLNNQFSMRYGVSIDNGAIKTVDFKTANRSNEWKQNVLSNTAIRKVKTEQLTPGKHTLKIYAIDPGVLLDRIAIDLGGLTKAYSVIPETKAIK